MSESTDQAQDRIADEILPQEGDEQVVETRRAFTGEIPDHKALDPKSDTYAQDKWQRAHEKRRLRAYLRGHSLFAHGRVPALPIGYQPQMWPVTPRTA